MENGNRFKCGKCGDVVYFDVNRHGKRYLAETAGEDYYDGGSNPRHASWKQPHYHSDEEVAVYQGRHQAAIARGEVVKGQTVEVFKGRKVPKGTTGVVFWVAPEVDGWGVTKVGFKTAEDEKHFINIENLQAQGGK